MNPLFERPLAIVDLETTGADPHRDRITEVAIVRVEGGEVVDRWSSLVDPEMPIPYRIQAFTGITNEMVAGAPNFRALADEIAQRLAGAVFVAHNARFDYNFLRAAFAARQIAFDPPVLCTVKLSRALYPEHARHGLDAIIERHGYAVQNRHRAMTDADLVWRLMQDAAANFDDDRLLLALRRAGSEGAAVPKLPEGDLEALPEAPGVYLLFGAGGQLLQCGRSNHLRSKVLGLFTGRGDAKSVKLGNQVRRVETEFTAGDLDSQLRELALLRRHVPEKYPTRSLGWTFVPNRRRPPVLEEIELHGSDPLEWREVFGSFRGQREADNTLRELALLHRLCPQRLGLENGRGACQAYGLKRCDGVCVDAERPEIHDARLLRALASLAPRAWPWPGPVAIAELHEDSGRAATHVFDQWCHLGSARDEAALAALLSEPPPRRFDLDIARLLQRWLMQPGHASAVRVLAQRDV